MLLRLVLAGLLAAALPAAADPLRIYAAGSLSGVMPELIAASGLPAEAVGKPVFGPAGLLRARIEGGEAADLFASADMAQPQRLADTGRFGPPVPFARNRLCLLSKAGLPVTPATLLDRMLDPAVRLATSTPGSDPGGDYAQAVFARAEGLHKGAQAALAGKALELFGGPTAMVPMNGHTPGGAILLADRADAVLYYCSSAPDILREVPGATSTPLPPELEPGPVNGMAVAPGNADAARLALFMLSPPGQAILARHHLLPMLAPSGPVLTVVGPSGRAISLSAAELGALPAVQATFTAEDGTAAAMAGPTLWSVLEAAGATGAEFRMRVRQVLTVTGRDGYGAALALGEIDPELEGKAVVLALTRNGAALDAPRLVLPGDKRLGRNVRDVTSMVVRP